MSFATLRQDRSSVLWMNLTPSETTPDHACNVPQRACRTTSAPVLTSRRSAVASHASISKAIRLSLLLTQTVAIMRYVRVFEFSDNIYGTNIMKTVVCIMKYRHVKIVCNAWRLFCHCILRYGTERFINFSNVLASFQHYNSSRN